VAFATSATWFIRHCAKVTQNEQWYIGIGQLALHRSAIARSGKCSITQPVSWSYACIILCHSSIVHHKMMKMIDCNSKYAAIVTLATFVYSSTVLYIELAVG